MTWRNWHLDVFALAGTAALVYGTARIYAPAAWIVGGVVLLAAATRGALR